MITYEYICNNCKSEFSEQQSIKDKPLVKCKSCKKNTLERVVTGGLCSIMMHNSNTIGSQMDKNTKKMGHYELQEKRYYDNKNYKDSKRKSKEAAIKKITGKDVKLPENVESFCDKETLKKVKNMTPEQQEKWVRYG